MVDIANNQSINLFEERAEYLDREELIKWSVLTEKEDAVVRKLKGTGLKLLSGPRGSGKSTLLLRAHYELIEENEVIAPYVNYSRSISLEPLFRERANAIAIFRQWVIGLIVISIAKVISEKRMTPPSGVKSVIEFYTSFVSELEKGGVPDIPDHALTVRELVDFLNQMCADLAFSRCVLLLDDAAHAFSIEQQREFFEIFAALKSQKLSAKAAVYPGVTVYSPTFHVGHDAELINVWYNPEEEEYLKLMKRILQVRMPEIFEAHFMHKDNIVNLIALASFGIPRAFINMVSRMLKFGDTNRVRVDRSSALQSIREQAELNNKVFNSIKSRIYRYSKYIEIGEYAYNAMIDRIAFFNRGMGRANSIGIKIPIPQNIDRMLGLMEYSGIVRSIGEVSQGNVGKFQAYQIHYANLISKNALGMKTGYSVDEMVEFFVFRARARYPLVQVNSLISEAQMLACSLELPDCEKCGTKRVSENQKFCMSCGNELISPSIYREMLNADITNLPLTQNKIEKLEKSGKFKKIEDVIIDDEGKLREIKGIGPYWSNRIKTAAEEFVRD